MGIAGFPGGCSSMELSLELLSVLELAVAVSWVSLGSSSKGGKFSACSIQFVDA